MPIVEWVDRRHAAPAAAANSEGVVYEHSKDVVYELARSRSA
jgi:hypothetical protein